MLFSGGLDGGIPPTSWLQATGSLVPGHPAGQLLGGHEGRAENGGGSN